MIRGDAPEAVTDLADRLRDRIGWSIEVGPHDVTADRIRAYADLLGYSAARFRDPAVARAEGYPDVVAPPGYELLFTMEACLAALHHEDLGLPFDRNLHAGHDQQLHVPVVAGDRIWARVRLSEVVPKRRNVFYIFAISLHRADGRDVADSWSTHVVKFV